MSMICSTCLKLKTYNEKDEPVCLMCELEGLLEGEVEDIRV